MLDLHSMSTLENDFCNIYKDLKTSYPNISNLSDEDIIFIKTEIQTYSSSKRLVQYILTVTSLLILITTSILSITSAYSLGKDILPFIKLKSQYVAENYSALNFLTFMLSWAVINFLYIIPLAGNTNKGRKILDIPENLKGLNIKSKLYRLTTLIGTYFLIGFILLFVSSIEKAKLLFFPIAIYLLIPVALIYIGVLFAISIGVFSYTLQYFFKKSYPYRYSNDIKIEIYCILLNTLKITKNQKFFSLSTNKTVMIINRLLKIPNLIASIPNKINEAYVDASFNEEFIKASIEFEKSIKTFLMNNKKRHIEETIIKYLNIISSGDLSQLPKSETLLVESKTNKRSLQRLLLLAVYLTVPIIIILVLKFVFIITLDEYIQSLIQILYIIWAFIGIFVNPYFINSESRDLLKDFFKTLTGRS